jgi:hypothetical protein
MAWNPFRAIGDAIGRVFGRGEQPASPEPPPAAPEPSPPAAVPERRGGLAALWDRVSGADRRQEEADRERQLEERLRQLEERERQLVERERQIEVREQAAPPAPAPEQAISPAPPAPAQAAPLAQVPTPERELPKFAADASDYLARDERAFGVDSELGRELDGAVADFIADRGGLDGLSVDAREWLQTPTISEPFSNYWQSGGFSADQVLAGMQNITNIQIKEGDDGEVHIEFDYDADVDGYEVHGHASS